MIQIYRVNNTDFTKNGDMVLFPSSCEHTAILKGAWSLVLEHPLDEEGRWKYIEKEAVLSVKTFMPDPQLFRIYSVERSDNYITAAASPIFFDSAKEVFHMDIRPTQKTAQEALDLFMEGTKYQGTTNITKAATSYQIRKNLLEILNGDADESFINRYGGEPLYDNYTVVFNEQVGGDYGVEIRYGKNLEEINEKVDLSDVITRIVPVAFNGYTLDGTTPWVDSPLIDAYATVYTQQVRFEDIKLTDDAAEDEESYPTVEELRAALREAAAAEFDKGVDQPSVTLEIKMADLYHTEEYRNYKILEEVGLGDTVHCAHYKLGIVTDARVIEIVWDCIKERPISLKIGDVDYNYFNNLTKTMSAVDRVIDKKNNTLIADRVSGVLNAMNTQLRYQKSIAQKQDIRAILFEDFDPDSVLYGAMCLGSQGFQIANKRTADGKGWDWTTAATANGVLADTIVAGLLASRDGSSYWDLSTGEIKISGTLTSETSARSVIMSSGGLRFYEGSIYAGRVVSSFLKPDPSKRGIGITTNREYILMGKKDEDTDDGSTYYAMNIVNDFEGYTERHLFWGTARFTGGVNIGGTLQRTSGMPYLYCVDWGYGILQRMGRRYVSGGYWLQLNDSEGAAIGMVELTISDERLKKNIKDSTASGLKVINRIRHIDYDWIETGDRIENAYSAQQLHAVNERLAIHDEENDSWHFDSNAILQFVTKGMQELSVEVDKLKKEIKILKEEAHERKRN